MGHRRLSIIDLSSSGKQPMNSNCGRFVLTFNGEIYNHLDLRVELEKQGHSTNWRGYSDTETLIEAIAHWGLDDALCRTRGMFALAIWDKKQRNLSLARDRIGEKPLYWGWAESDLIFGSELKSLRAHPNCQNGICIDALSQYLRYMYVPSPLAYMKVSLNLNLVPSLLLRIFLYFLLLENQFVRSDTVVSLFVDIGI